MLTRPSPKDLGLPYPDWHPGQWETITRLACSDKRIILLEAPTGSGKSGIVKGLANLLDLNMLVLTGTLQLQDQYEESLGITTARGRGNFVCQLEPWNRASDGVCTLGSSCVHKTYTRHIFYPPEEHGKGCLPCADAKEVPCEYYFQRFAAGNAKEVVLNYAYWLSLANYTGSFRGYGLTVFDEAHTIDDEVRRFATVRFSRRAVDALGFPLPWFDAGDLVSWFEWAESLRDRFDREYRNIVSGRAGPPTDPADAQRRRHVLGLCRAADMLLCQPPDSWVGEQVEFRGVKTGTTEFKPVWVSGLVKLLVTRHAGDKMIFMSGTILDPEFYAESIGVEYDQIDFVRVPSTFPVKNRPVYYEPVGKVNTRDAGKVTEVVKRIDQIIALYPEKKGIIHTVSHKLAGEIIRQSKYTKRMIGHVREDKARQLEFYRRSADGIWVSPSSGTGVDLPYEECEWQIISKLPFPDLGDKQVRQMMKGENLPSASRWYNWATACGFMQMVGRGMRAPDDRCDSYLLDGNWSWFRHYMYKTAPDWFLKSIRKPRMFTETGPEESVDDMLARILSK